MTNIDTPHRKPLAGWRILVPRGGTWGEEVAASLRTLGAVPVVAPLINFAAADDEAELSSALTALSAGQFDWLTITSATTVDVLYAHQVKVPGNTKVAAVGATTARALEQAGYEVSLVPDRDNSAIDLANQMIAQDPLPKNILSLRGQVAKPILAERLRSAGLSVRSVVAYQTVGTPCSERIHREVESGRINAILITSESVAQQIREQFASIPAETLLIAIGSQAALDAAQAGLSIATDSDDERAVDALVDAVSQFTLPHAADEFAP